MYAHHLNEAFQGDLEAVRAAAHTAGVATQPLEDRLAAFNEARRARRKNEVIASEVRQAPTSFDLKGLDGERVQLNDFEGRILILNFWATW